MMLFIMAIIIAILLGIFAVIKRGEEEEESEKTLEERLQELEDFTATEKIMGWDYDYLFAIDAIHRKLVLLEIGYERLISYDDVMAVELIIDDKTYQSRSLGRTLGGSIIGGLLGGGAGAIVGGLSGNQEINKKIDKIVVNIKVRDIKQPAINIVCYDSQNNHSSVKRYLEQATRITDMMNVIIDELNSKSQSLVDNNAQAENNHLSLAEELSKLAELRDKGILTEEEFETQKKKMLKN